MASSFFWYDYETTGINPRCDRPIQVAGIRTDEHLNEIDSPLNIYCQLSDDILPHPAACLVTGITPAQLQNKGLAEHEFIRLIQKELATPGTCGAGYNSLRFDDEMTRYSFYRNFIDPYAREWQNGNSRWDLIDLVRASFALRPEGINWPQESGRITIKLDQLTVANSIEHTSAHDALSDVRATIALAKLVKEKQPRLYQYLYRLRSKHEVLKQIKLLTPVVHVSGRVASQRNYLTVVLPLAWHPVNRNALIVCDLSAEISPLLIESAQCLARKLYTRHAQLADEELPVPLKLIHINRCPVVAPLSVLRSQDIERLSLNLSLCLERATQLVDEQAVWQDKLKTIYSNEQSFYTEDPEQQLYDGFLSTKDKLLSDRIRQSSPEILANTAWDFDQPKLAELLFRYRARNFKNTLTNKELHDWSDFCARRLTDPRYGSPHVLKDFFQSINDLEDNASPSERVLLQQWDAYAKQLKQRLTIE
ncbi:UNVERIFIED_CONTAM: hypothetical protein GTU68_062069 [Idotea baltica]|nr:hypothetical protein [Idotea baltica]